MKKCEHCETTAVVVRTVTEHNNKLIYEINESSKTLKEADKAGKWALKHIHQLEAERDGWKEAAEATRATFNERDERITALEAGLRKYGGHTWECRDWWAYYSPDTPSPKCTCGLTDLIGENK